MSIVLLAISAGLTVSTAAGLSQQQPPQKSAGSSLKSSPLPLRKPLPESFDTWKSILGDLWTGCVGSIKSLGRVGQWISNPRLIDKTPLVSVLLLEIANIQQLWRMWSTSTAEGQSLWGWICVHIALWLWLNFYRVFNRENRFAIWGTAIGILLNGLVILSVVWFRYVAG